MKRYPEFFLAEQLFLHGCSSGASATLWQAVCLNLKYPGRISAFATHSTGLKIKGDGILMGCDLYDTDYWGECAECEYFPVTLVEAPGVKACIFDNYQV